MAMGRKQAHPCLLQSPPKTQGHPFYQTLEQLLTQHDFDGFVEQTCRIQKREYLAASAQNLGLLMRQQHGVGTPRSLQSRRPAIAWAPPELPWQRYSDNPARRRASL